jgi:signal transduction histidine kinase
MPWWHRYSAARWLQQHADVADALLALVVGGLVVLSGVNPQDHAYRAHNALSIGVIVLSLGALVVRRRYPFAVVLVDAGAALVLTIGDFNSNGAALPALVALYTVAAHRPRRVSWWALALVVPLVTAVVVLDDGVQDQAGAVVIANVVVFATAWILGDNLQTRRKYVSALEERADRLEHDRADQARRAVTYERARIARELHDVVAHHVGVMVVQAGAARRVLGRDPAQADAALETVEQTGREAMREMRAMLGVLRDEDAVAERDPQPGADALPALVAQVCDAGVRTTFAVSGDARPLPPGVDLSVYRIVQESLTNVMRHAGPNAAAHVALAYGPVTVEVSVTDDGRGASAETNSDGHGAVGMRERAALYGGTLRAGPRAGGGFAVHASFPIGHRS